MLKAISEAYELMMAADENGDHELSQLEAAKSAQLFHASKLFNWGAAVHTDLDQMYVGACFVFVFCPFFLFFGDNLQGSAGIRASYLKFPSSLRAVDL